jgi:hypothetical protein
MRDYFMSPIWECYSKQTNALVPTAHLLFTAIFTQALLGSMSVNNKCPIKMGHLFVLAESEGFEPPEPLSSTVFKTAAIDHSANSPGQK